VETATCDVVQTAASRVAETAACDVVESVASGAAETATCGVMETAAHDAAEAVATRAVEVVANDVTETCTCGGVEAVSGTREAGASGADAARPAPCRRSPPVRPPGAPTLTDQAPGASTSVLSSV
jgi:hypothetical protein